MEHDMVRVSMASSRRGSSRSGAQRATRNQQTGYPRQSSLAYDVYDESDPPLATTVPDPSIWGLQDPVAHQHQRQQQQQQQPLQLQLQQLYLQQHPFQQQHQLQQSDNRGCFDFMDLRSSTSKSSSWAMEPEEPVASLVSSGNMSLRPMTVQSPNPQLFVLPPSSSPGSPYAQDWDMRTPSGSNNSGSGDTPMSDSPSYLYGSVNSRSMSTSDTMSLTSSDSYASMDGNTWGTSESNSQVLQGLQLPGMWLFPVR
jgi:hypothetical protein